MSQSVHYAITNLTSPNLGRENSPINGPHARRNRLLADVARWSAEGVDIVQLREKNLDAGELFTLAKAARTALEESANPLRPRLLINGRPDVAIAAEADGVHLTSQPGELTPDQVRHLFRLAGLSAPFLSASCHTLAEIRARHAEAVDLILFGPVFGKTVSGQLVGAPTGLPLLAQACAAAAPIPVLALGGLTFADESACRNAGAAGLAGIRLFAQP